MSKLGGGRTGGVCVDVCLYTHMLKVFARVNTRGQNL